MSTSLAARVLCRISLGVVCLSLTTSLSRAERAPVPQWLPENTLAYLRIANAPDLIARFKDTSLGRLGADEQIRPIITQLYGSAADAFVTVENQTGSSLDEILSLPQGEFVIGLVAIENKRPSLVVLMDIGEGVETVNNLVTRAREAAANDGAKVTTENIDGIELIIAQPQGDRANEPPAVLFIKEQTVVLTTDFELSQSLLARWSGVPDDCLAKNKRFGAIMTRCVGKNDQSPQVTWFVDPIELARNVLRGNFAGAAGIAFLPIVGLDGLSGVGGSITLATESFDVLAHFHLLLENPRVGVLDMIALQGGDMQPESWVPADISRYFTLHWELDKTFHGAAELFDSFRSPGAFSAMIQQRISDNIDIDFEQELLPALTGRISHALWYERPIGPGAETRAIGFELINASEFSGTMSKAVARQSERLTEKSHGGIMFHQFSLPEVPDNDDQEADDTAPDNRREFRRAARRRQQPCVAIIGDYLVFTNRPSAMEKVINSYRDSDQSLASQLDYKLIASKVRRLTGDREPAMITFDRPEERLRALYDLLTAETTREWLDKRSENSRTAQVLNETLQDNPLPAFSIISQYLAPGGGVLANEETGFHYIDFVLRRNDDVEQP